MLENLKKLAEHLKSGQLGHDEFNISGKSAPTFGNTL